MVNPLSLLFTIFAITPPPEFVIWCIRWPSLQLFRGQLSGCWGHFAAGAESERGLRVYDLPTYPGTVNRWLQGERWWTSNQHECNSDTEFCGIRLRPTLHLLGDLAWAPCPHSHLLNFLPFLSCFPGFLSFPQKLLHRCSTSRDPDLR